MAFRQITQIGAVQLLGEGVVRNFRHDQCQRNGFETLQQFHDFSECDMICGRHRAIFSLIAQYCVQSVEIAMMFPPLQSIQHFGNQVVNVEQLQLRRRVIDLNRQIIGNVATKRGDSRIVIRAAPFSEKIRKAVDQYPRSGFPSVCEKQFFSSKFGFAIIGLTVAPDQSRLNRTGNHYRTGIV